VAQILQLRGPRAASEFRLAKLVSALKTIDPAVRAVASASVAHASASWIRATRTDAQKDALLASTVARNAGSSAASASAHAR